MDLYSQNLKSSQVILCSGNHFQAIYNKKEH